MQGTVLGAKDTLHRAYTVLGANLENIWGKRIPGREDSKCKFSKARITVILRKRECGMSLENAWESSGMGEKRCRQRNGGRWSLGHFKNTDAFFRFYI